MHYNEHWYKDALLVNRDACWYILLDESGKDAMERSVREYFRSFGGDKVTDVLLCVLEQTAVIPSESFQFRGDKYLQTRENGFPVDYSGGRPGDLEHLEGLYKCFREYGIDVPRIFTETMRELNIRPWLTLRMNDAHFGLEKTNFLRADMYYEASAAGETIGDRYGIYTHCYDFRHGRYPNAVRSFIAEALERYDVFGLELDFMRYIYCFDYINDPQCHRAMTKYIRSIRQVADRAGKKWGHPIKLMIRTCRDPEDSLAFGLDIKTLCEEKIIDAVVTTPEGIVTDSGLPVSQWKALAAGKIPVFAGLEARNVNMTVSRLEHLKAYAAAFYAGGADGIYLNNHEYDRPQHHAARCITRENCTQGRREFVVTWQDTVAEGNPAYCPLPLPVAGEAQLSLKVGPIALKNKVRVVIDFEGKTFPTLSAGEIRDIRGNLAKHVTELSDGKPLVLTEYTPISYDLTDITTENDLLLTFTGSGIVHYVNVMIES